MTTKEKIAVMQAFEDGKKCQARLRGRNEWIDFEITFWNFEEWEYRIKPEEVKPALPKYREIPTEAGQ
jgi:hypothetical protein